MCVVDRLLAVTFTDKGSTLYEILRLAREISDMKVIICYLTLVQYIGSKLNCNIYVMLDPLTPASAHYS